MILGIKKTAPVRVMVVDDSAVIRGMLTRLLESDPEIQVASSLANGQQALDQLDKINPDVILLDVEMPVLDGISALQAILAKKPSSKVIMCSSLTQRNATTTLKAMELGAIDCLGKPNNPADIGSDGHFRIILVNLVKTIGREAKRPGVSSPGTAREEGRSSLSAPGPLTLKPPPTITTRPDFLAIGSSTGGPQALFQVLKNVRNPNVPIVITQHMPPTFTAILAQHITMQSGLPAFEGADGMILERGHVYVAPGGKHMTFTKDPRGLMIMLDDGAPENFCKPAVDVMLRSLLQMAGPRFLTVILTGMGHDGLAACKTVTQQGGRVLAQDEASSVVWGMPGAVAKAGICEAVLPLADMGSAITTMLNGGRL